MPWQQAKALRRYGNLFDLLHGRCAFIGADNLKFIHRVAILADAFDAKHPHITPFISLREGIIPPPGASIILFINHIRPLLAVIRNLYLIFLPGGSLPEDIYFLHLGLLAQIYHIPLVIAPGGRPSGACVPINGIAFWVSSCAACIIAAAGSLFANGQVPGLNIRGAPLR